MFTPKEILQKANGLKEYTTGIYRLLHALPEVAHQEIETNRLLRKELDAFNIPYLSPAPNITIAIVQSNHPGPTIGLRCDTDALPVMEETGLAFASKNKGVMHACGHDGHMAIGLSAAKLLHAHRDQWRGQVKVIFQPAEEGEGGADLVIKTGLVKDVDVFFAIHLWSPYPSGTLHVAPVTVSAAVNMFTIRITGKGGHGATPEKCADALVAGSFLVTSLQTVVSRALSPMEPSVLTVGSFHAGTVGNIIAQEAVLKGTIRTLNDQSRQLASQALESHAHHIGAIHGCTVVVENLAISDAVQNNVEAAAVARACAYDLVDPKWIGEQKTMMLGDDFANYGTIAPYCYAQVGIADEAKGTHYAHHNSHFCIDEEVLPLSVAWMVAFCAAWGEKEQGNP